MWFWEAGNCSLEPLSQPCPHRGAQWAVFLLLPSQLGAASGKKVKPLVNLGELLKRIRGTRGIIGLSSSSFLITWNVGSTTILCHEVARRLETKHQELAVMERTEAGKPEHWVLADVFPWCKWATHCIFCLNCCYFQSHLLHYTQYETCHEVIRQDYLHAWIHIYSMHFAQNMIQN